jgi:hypothetical protein
LSNIPTTANLLSNFKVLITYLWTGFSAEVPTLENNVLKK